MPIDKDKAIKILREAIDRGFKACESYLINKKMQTCSWIFLNEVGTVFREHNHPEFDVKIKISKTLVHRTKEVLETIQEKDEQRKTIEKILMKELLDIHDKNNQ